jgi:hypothetical protein
MKRGRLSDVISRKGAEDSAKASSSGEESAKGSFPFAPLREIYKGNMDDYGLLGSFLIIINELR